MLENNFISPCLNILHECNKFTTKLAWKEMINQKQSLFIASMQILNPDIEI